nr:immunoglobulin light chain junction region [Macaca mulatta]
CLQGYSIPYSF